MPNGDVPPGQYVTIRIPGVQDIISMPYFESEQLKRERLTRWTLNATESPIPEPLRWLPQLINWLDDAQDQLIVGLTLAIPLLRRLPSRFIPYLGWVLLANDALNLLTATASAPLVPRQKKIGFLKFTKRAAAGHGAHVAAAETFLLPGRAKFIPFTLQAGQVLYSYTGWGLKLGTIMGTISDFWWGMFRELQGQRGIIQGPPPNDLAGKAARVLAQSYNWNALELVANPFEIGLMINATNMAAGILGAPRLPLDTASKLDALADATIPLYSIENPQTRSALAAMGFPTLRDQRPATPTFSEYPTFAGATRACIAENPTHDVDLAIRLRADTYDWPYGLQASEAAQWNWDVFGGGYDFVVPTASPMQRILGMALETSVLPPFLAFPYDQRVLDRATLSGLPFAPYGECTLTGVLNKLLPPQTRFPAVYPPPSDDPNVQIAHWCAIALALWCRRGVHLPIFNWLRDCAVDLYGYIYFKDKVGTQCANIAATLVWGRAYHRLQAPQTQEPTPPTKKPGICRNTADDWPSLSGQLPELDALRMILQAIPRIAPPPVRTRAELQPQPTPTGSWLATELPPTGIYQILTEVPPGRDWLDAYMKSVDPRRTGRPPFPAIDPPLDPLDSDPNPDDATRYWSY